MVTVRKKTIGTKTYYYLEHTFRINETVSKKEKYLGHQLPKDLEKIKKEFLAEFYKERWYLKLNAIHDKYQKESGKIPPSSFKEELKKFAIKFTYDTQKIEGSTLTLRETANLIERGITPHDKSIVDTKEAETHNSVFLEMFAEKKDISLQLILYWHHKLLKQTKEDIAGKIRQHQVAISGSTFLPPSPVEVYPLITEFFKWYNKNKLKLHPVELAALVHLKFVTIHPFADGNGRMSRLMMNFVLKKAGYPMLNILYTNRNSYYTALERSQTKRIDIIFVQWLFKRYLKENSRFLR